MIRKLYFQFNQKLARLLSIQECQLGSDLEKGQASWTVLVRLHGKRGRASGYPQPNKPQWYTCVSFLNACTVFMLYLDDITNAYWKKKGLVILD